VKPGPFIFLFPATAGRRCDRPDAPVKAESMRLLVSILLLAASASAQTFQGSLRGRVLDPTGAAVRTAQLSLTDEATSAIRSTISNDDGEYVFSAVTPSTYIVSVEATGFKTIEQHGIAIATQAAVSG
jgi:trimeric autotransporter adhesin